MWGVGGVIVEATREVRVWGGASDSGGHQRGVCVCGEEGGGECDPHCVPLQPMRIHISEATADLLQETNFIVEERGKVEVKVCCSH